MLFLKALGLVINLMLAILCLALNRLGLGVYLFLLTFYQLYIYIAIKNLDRLTYFNRRAKVLSMVFYLILVTIISRAISVQIINGRLYKELLREQITDNSVKSGLRGIIYDVSGKKLAYNTNIYNMVVDPTLIMPNPLAVELLKKITKENLASFDYKDTIKKLDNLATKEVRYKVIAKKIDEEKKQEIDKLIKENKIPSNDIYFEKIVERKYYKRASYQYLVGNIGYPKNSAGYAKIGVFGLEKYYERYMKENVIKVKSYFTKKRDITLPTSAEMADTALNGKNLYLAVDDDIEYILNSEIEKQFNAKNAEEAYGIVMNPNNGEIIATAYFSRSRKELRNPIFQDQLEPGSIFKPMVIAAALEEKYITPNSKFNIGDGKLLRFGHVIKEATSTTKGVLTPGDILKFSSNTGMVMVGDNFSNEKLNEWFERFGFYEKSGVDFPDELKPYSMPYKKWDGLKKATMTFGQGIAVTPIQVITAFSSLVNGGILYRPHIANKVVDQNGVVIRRNLPFERRRTISKETSDTLRGMLQGVVDLGGGKNAKVSGYTVGGKTGTAQIPVRGGYMLNDYISSFMGFFPVENPQYVILVMFNKPQDRSMFARYGGAISAPVFSSIVSRIAESKSIRSQNVRVLKNADDFKLPVENYQTISNEVMVDLTGKSTREVLQIFKNSRYKIVFRGSGTVVKSQYPLAEQTLDNIETITVELGHLQAAEEQKNDIL